MKIVSDLVIIIVLYYYYYYHYLLCLESGLAINFRLHRPICNVIATLLASCVHLH